MNRPAAARRPPARAGAPPLAVVGGRLCTDLVEVTSDLAALESGGFWAVVLPFTGAPDLRPVRDRPACHAVARAALGRAGPGGLEVQPGPRGLHGGRGEHPVRDRGGRRLPGEPDPPVAGAAPAASPGGVQRHRGPGCGPGGRQPCPVLGGGPPPRPRRGGGQRLAGAVPVPPGRQGVVLTHQGDGRPGRRVPGQGPGRERDDRGPGAQRPGAGVSLGLGDGAVAARGGAAPGPVPPGEHGGGTAAPRCGMGRGDRRHVPARVGDRCPQAGCAWIRSPDWRPNRGACTAAPSAGSTPTAGRGT